MDSVVHFTVHTSTLLQILLLGIFGFLLSMAITPIYTTLAYRGQWWKKQRTEAWSGGTATVYNKLHAEKHKRNIPTMAGMVFVVSIAIVTLFNLKRGET